MHHQLLFVDAVSCLTSDLQIHRARELKAQRSSMNDVSIDDRISRSQCTRADVVTTVAAIIARSHSGARSPQPSQHRLLQPRVPGVVYPAQHFPYSQQTAALPYTSALPFALSTLHPVASCGAPILAEQHTEYGIRVSIPKPFRS